MKQKPINELKKRLGEITHLSSILSLLSWDQDVYMPTKGAASRATSISHLSAIVHSKIISLDVDRLLTKLKKEFDEGKIRGQNAVIIAETWQSFSREIKLPESFVRELSETTSRAQAVWVEARKNNDFDLFLPWLTKIVKLKRQEAKYVGYTKSPYDALIDYYEPGMTTEKASEILNDLKDFLTPFIKKIKSSSLEINQRLIEGNFPIDQQLAFNKYVVGKLGFDFEAGRIDTTTHPFEAGLSPLDVRITTRYREKDLLYSLGSIIHEAGHGLYDQGLPVESFGTPLSEAISLGIHESQSRLWEKIIGQSQSFWNYFYPKLQKAFPLPYQRIDKAEFYRIINKVSPSLIRTESDEVTYNLHIILRFELEKEMIEGSIDLKDLPQIWKSKMKDYFGITVPNDRLGVLQDVHWSAGLIGYFPTYAFGNLYSAQFFSALKTDIPDVDKMISRGNFLPIKDWLKKNIHSHGKYFKASELIKRVSGEELNSAYFIEYLKDKYQKIYFK